MRNPISATYQLFDDTLMTGANYAVRSYNWTTGGTKEDLANNLVSAWVIALSIGEVFREGATGVICAPIYFAVGHFNQKNNNSLGKKETDALRKGYLDPYTESGKTAYKITGPMCLAWGASHLVFAQSFDNENLNLKLANVLDGIGFGLCGTSMYVMRADPVKPGKSVFSRIGDRASELYEGYRKPALQPFEG